MIVSQRLSIIRCALQHLLTDQERKRIAILMEGVVYSMVEEWSSPDEDEIAILAGFSWRRTAASLWLQRIYANLNYLLHVLYIVSFVAVDYNISSIVFI
jgi:hypothetical protein